MVLREVLSKSGEHFYSTLGERQRGAPVTFLVRPFVRPQMHEPTLDLAKANWSRQKEVVRVFYKEMWDHANTSLVPQIFHAHFTFRGSLGPQLVGHEQFIGYVKFVTGALDRYTSDILALGEEGNQVFGKLRFHGYHRRELFEVPPSGRHVWWYGTPIFTFDGGLVRDLWVLGDIHGLIGRLKGTSSAEEA